VAHKPDAKAINEGTPPRRGSLERDNELGQRIRELRMERSLSLAGLAARVGVTRSFLSSVERGVAYPSILVLRTIAAALEVPVFLLFTGRESSGVVVHRHERKIIKLPSAPVSYELISPDAQHRMEMIITYVRPGAEPPAMSHDGEECALVLRGHVMLTIGGIEYELNEGDSIYYNSGLPHTVRTVGDEEAEIISAITPPSF
jgi:transcriptional regulator with XRE-family HTH domain